MIKATIFNIQHFSIHDGEGIRTTLFFKGCPLHCAWCHNPESIEPVFSLLYDKDKCTSCGECVKRCKRAAVALLPNGEGVKTDMTKCSFDGTCVFYCVNSAREIVGEKRTVAELVKEAQKDVIFFQESGGGVTLSGGEPLLQIEFVERFVIELSKKHIDVTIDTCGNVPFSNFERVAKYVSTFLYDLKAMNSSVHKEFTGVGNTMIIENLRKLAAIHNNIHIRMPIIAGVNDNKEHLDGALELIKELGIKRVSLLPYHDIAAHKYNKLGRAYRGSEMAVPSKEYMEECRKLYADNGLNVTIGG